MLPNIFSKTTIVKARQNFLISPQEVKFIDVPSGCERNNVFMGLIMRMFLKQVFSVKLLLVADLMSAEDTPPMEFLISSYLLQGLAPPFMKFAH